MAEPYNKQEKKLVFPEGLQKDFFDKIKEESGLTWKRLAKIASVNRRTLSDWKSGKHTPSLKPTQKLADRFNVNLPSSVEIKDRYWTNQEAAKAGGRAKHKKYGAVCQDEKKRKQKWRSWWDEKGKIKNMPPDADPKPITKPNKSKKLAEFIGIMIGDGGITEYQVRVTLNSEDDKQYANFVKKLITNLFDVPAIITSRTNQKAMDLVVSRKSLVRHCQDLGLPQGSKVKNSIDIPDWIMNNKDFQKACIRGIFDTDGCIFREQHKVNGEKYSYPRLYFVSAIPVLRKTIKSCLSGFGWKARERNDRAITLEKRQDIVQFFSVVGSNNPKHEKRFDQFV